MDIASTERCDSFSPEAKPYLSTMNCTASPTCQRGQVDTKAIPKYTFIMAKISDFDAKLHVSGQSGVPRKVSVKKTQASSRDLKRPPGLAATHPALYQGATKACQQRMPPPSLLEHRIKKEKSHHVTVETIDMRSTVPWRTYVDPKSLTSLDPAFDDPRVRMLRADVLNSHARVISPVLMVGLPCGTIVEAAHVYDDNQGQPRDPPSS